MMQPIVHGLERSTPVEFISCLNTGEARTADARKRLGFKSTPQIILLNRDGMKLRESTGIVSERYLAAGHGALLAVKPQVKVGVTAFD